MIIDIFDKLIDRLIQLREKEINIKRTLFESHVQPIFEVFEDLHNNYIESFRGYRKAIQKTSNYNAEVDIICDQISTDNLFAENKRNKLASLYTTKQLKELESFVMDIFRYLIGSIEQALGSEFGDDIYERIDQYYIKKGGGDGFFIPAGRTQYYRVSLIEDLQRIKDSFNTESEMKSEAVSKLDEKVRELQENYSYVVSEYAKLKETLLSAT